MPLPAETSREAPKCCAWQHQERGPKRARVPSRRAARLPSAAPGSIKGGGPETRSGTVQSLKCCPCQQTSREAAKCCAWQHQGGRPEPEVLPLPAETSREAPKCCAWQHQGGGPRNALGHRPEPEVLPLPAETSREAPKCVSSVKRARAP